MPATYLKHGCLEIDNTCSERSMKPVALGRKNHLFVGSEGGGKSAAIAYTLIENGDAEPCRSTGAIHRLGLPTSSAGSPTARSLGSTTSCPGVTPRPQRNRLTPRSTRAPSPDGHPIAHGSEEISSKKEYPHERRRWNVIGNGISRASCVRMDAGCSNSLN